jgi:F-type H+-transporting ATPase subunit b
MRLRRHLWPGGIVCLVAVLFLMPSLGWAASEEGGGLVNLDRSLIIQVVNFLVLLLILWRLLYRPLLATMEQRSEAIRKSLEEAQAARAEAARQQEENTARLRQAHAEAAAIREQALKEASDEQRRLVEAARVEAQRLVDTARAQTEADIRRAREELRREVAELATAVAEKLIHKSLREEDHRRVIDDSLSRLGR